MHSLDFYIGELLYEYDCVIVSGLGGFITQSSSARLMRDMRRIYPPSRMVSFNAMLSHDDGLLANAIAREEHISYRDALKRVEEYASGCLKILHAGREVSLEGIGSISCSPEGNLIFRPFPDANLSASHFGLDSIYVHPVKPEPAQRSRTVERMDRKPKRVKRKSPAPVKWTIALSLPIILLLLYGIIFPYSFQQVMTSYTGIATDLFKGSLRDANVKVIESKPEIISNKEQEKPATPVILPEKDKVFQADIVAPANIQLPAGPKYYIIGGCFENESNAHKFREFLKSRGFDAEVAGTNNRGHLRISYKSFPVKQDALIYLDEIRQAENPSAWLLKY